MHLLILVLILINLNILFRFYASETYRKDLDRQNQALWLRMGAILKENVRLRAEVGALRKRKKPVTIINQPKLPVKIKRNWYIYTN